MRRDKRVAECTEAGFSLVEVIAALVVLAIIATAAAFFFIQGTRTSTHLQRTQNAVAVANEAMEMAFAVEPRDSLAVPGLTTLAVGRTQTEVTAAWAAAAALGAAGVDETYPVWDSTATATTVDALPLAMDRRYSGQDYHVSVLVGTCFRYATVSGGDQECTKLPGFSTDPGDTPAGVTDQVVRMLRVIAIVSWQATIGECAGGTCFYQLSGLIDRNADIRWDTSLSPVAVDDSAIFDRSAPGSTTSIEINVLRNDIFSRLASYPVRIETLPGPGCGSAVADATTGTVTYTFTAAPASGICTFTYSLKDGQGTVSHNEGVVSVLVLPLAANDVANVISGVPAAIGVTGNDNGTYASVQVASGPSHGSATVSGLNVVYTSSEGYAGEDSLTYTYMDQSGQVSGAACVAIHVASFPVRDWTVDVPGRPVGPEVWTSLEETITTGIPSPADYRINIVGARPAAGILQVDGSAVATTGTDVNYSPPANTPGEYRFQFSLTRIASGWTSATKTVTLRVQPLFVPVLTAVADNLGNYTHNDTRVINVGGNDTPTTFPSTLVRVQFTQPSSGCGSIAAVQPPAVLESGGLEVALPKLTGSTWSRSCSFTYTLVGQGVLSGLTSGPVTVRYTIVR